MRTPWTHAPECAGFGMSEKTPQELKDEADQAYEDIFYGNTEYDIHCDCVASELRLVVERETDQLMTDYEELINKIVDGGYWDHDSLRDEIARSIISALAYRYGIELA